MTRAVRPTWLLAAFLAALVVAPLVLPEFSITLANYIGLYALVALGLVLLTGVGGLTSFGQAAFVGLGAYTTAVLTTSTALPSWLAWLGASAWLPLLAGLLLTMAVAWALGALTLKLSGHFLPLGDDRLGHQFRIPVRHLGDARRLHRAHGHPADFDFRRVVRYGQVDLLPDLVLSARRHADHAQPARFARGPCDPCTQGRHGDGRIDGR